MGALARRTLQTPRALPDTAAPLSPRRRVRVGVQAVRAAVRMGALKGGGPGDPGKVLSVTVRVKPAQFKSWAFVTFAEDKTAKAVIEPNEKFFINDADGKPAQLKIKAAEVDKQLKKAEHGGGALASMWAQSKKDAFKGKARIGWEPSVGDVVRLKNPQALHYGAPRNWLTTGVGKIIIGGERHGFKGTSREGGEQEYLLSVGGVRLWAKQSEMNLIYAAPRLTHEEERQNERSRRSSERQAREARARARAAGMDRLSARRLELEALGTAELRQAALDAGVKAETLDAVTMDRAGAGEQLPGAVQRLHANHEGRAKIIELVLDKRAEQARLRPLAPTSSATGLHLVLREDAAEDSEAVQGMMSLFADGAASHTPGSTRRAVPKKLVRNTRRRLKTLSSEDSSTRSRRMTDSQDWGKAGED